MKRVSTLIFIFFILAGCKKSTTPMPQGIVGTWELSLEVGGIAGITNHYAPGNGNILQLNTDSTYQRFSQGVLTYHGTYQIIKNGITISADKFDGIFFDHNTVGEVIQLDNSTLTIGMDYNDGIASSYTRK